MADVLKDFIKRANAISDARRARAFAEAAIAHCDKRIAAKDRQVERLVAALRPFAAEADNWWEKVDRRYRPGMTEPRQSYANEKAAFSIGDLRRAKKLVTEMTGKKTAGR